ncbi:MAG: primosomal protein N' [Deltaproteobacteria bacterium]|nr:primosomal protein N' [Deltaproteobacteria bacterium]
MKQVYAEVAVKAPLDRTFTYAVPPDLAPMAVVGKRCLASFGRRTLAGFIVSIGHTPPAGVDAAKIKPIIDVIDPLPLFDHARLGFYKWLASYYFAPIGEAFGLICPAPVDVKSRKAVCATPAGILAAARANGLAREVLLAAQPRSTLSALLRRFKGRSVYATVERLRGDGLLAVEESQKSGAKAAFERYVKAASPDAGALDKLTKKSPVQARVLIYLIDNGETSVAVLKDVFASAAPALKALEAKGLVTFREERLMRDPLAELVPKDASFAPNAEQAAAIDAVKAALNKGGYNPFLLYGVTGSGKTLVYLHCLEEAVRLGKKAVFLTPEIALTPWPAAYLAARFPGRVAVAHSGLASGERMDEWERILSGKVDIVVGARSALFTPLPDLGVIIVDEEHETSYKQEDGVRYHARDAALMLGKSLGITVVLGSATPSVETFHNAKTGRLTPLYLRKRVEERPLPAIEVVDMKGGAKSAALGDRLKGALGAALASGAQALLFLNRRGFSNFIICKDCGNTFQCVNCSVTMTMHKRAGELRCHYCDLAMPLPDECPVCKGSRLVQPGLGTERVEEEIRTLFPDARIGRMDRDTTRQRGSAKAIIDAVEAKRIDCLIGTQMVSKGHHFPGITLVGVISGDTSLNMPDFRAAERTFQVITQAAGRAGRGADPGTVIIQTLNPGHYCFTRARTHDYDGFFEDEIAERRDAVYPPFARLCSIRLEGVKEERVMRAADGLRVAAERLLAKAGAGIRFLGPAPAPLHRLKGRYRHQMLVKAVGRQNLGPMRAFVTGLKAAFEAGANNGVALVIDMDPAAIM